MQRLFLLVAALVLTTSPTFAQAVDCANIPQMMTAEPAQYADCQPASAASSQDIDPALATSLFRTTKPAFGINLRAGSVTTRGFIGFNATNPATTTSILATTDNFYGGDYAGDDFTKVYAVLVPAAPAIPDLYTINPATGARTLIGTTGLPVGASPTDMAWDYTTSTMYMTEATTVGTATTTSLYTVNLTTGAATLVAPITGTGFALGINLLAHPFTGVLYSVELGADALYSINKTTGAATLIGPIGYNLNFAQGADFDNATGTAYLCAYQGAGVNTLRTVDLITGASTSVGSFTNAEVDICSIGTALGTAPTGPILTASPGTVSFGTAQTVGTTSAPQTVTLSNPGTVAVTITSITGSGAPFTVNQTGTSLTLAPGTATTFTVTFTPTNTTAATGTVTIVSNAPSSPTVVNLTGTGNADVTTTIPAGSTVGAPTFNRGDAATCVPATGTTGTAVAYVTRPFTVATAGNHTITTTYPAGFDGYISLYQGTFNPAASCTNRIAFSDDFGGVTGSQILNQALTAGSYVLVVTGYNNAAAGSFTGTVVGPAAVTFQTTAGEGTARNATASLSATPNPVRDAARVRFTTATAQDVTVAVYDVTGRQVATLFQGAVAADQTVEASLDASSLPSGVYVVRATGADVNLTQRVTVVR